MNRIWIIIIVAMIFTACGQNKGEGNDGQNSSEEVSTDQNTKTEDAKPIILSEDDFAEKVFDFRKKGEWKYKGDKPCIVDFYADWCGPCKQIGPYMKEFAKTYNGKMYMYKVNVDNARELSLYFDITGIPAVMFCPLNGNYKMVVGANPKETYVSLIETFLQVKK
jgi:thioredoxin 1